MKRIYLNLFILILLVGFWTGCDDQMTGFDKAGGYYGEPSDLQSVTAESLPGQILLRWEVPADSGYQLVKISYYDYLTEKNVVEVASVYTDSLLVDNTRARYGDYEFTLQPFNSNREGGNPVTITAQSGAATVTTKITATKVTLTAGQLSTNYQEPTEGPIANLLDGNVSTFFHTRWSSPQSPMPHYIQIDLNEPLQNFKFYYQNRNGSQVGAENLQVQISNDGMIWETVAEITSGLPSASKGEFTSEIFQPGRTFTHFRYNVTKTYGSKNYFNMAEFALYDVLIEVYDPEVDEIE